MLKSVESIEFDQRSKMVDSSVTTRTEEGREGGREERRETVEDPLVAGTYLVRPFLALSLFHSCICDTRVVTMPEPHGMSRSKA